MYILYTALKLFVYHHYIHSDQEQDPLDLIQYSALRLSSRNIIMIVCVIIFFLWSQRNSSASWYCIWSGDLQTCAHKSRNANHRPWGLLWCLEVWAQFWWGGIQKNNHGLGNENWNRSQAGSSLKCFRTHPESKGPVISSFYGALNSYHSCHYPPWSSSFCHLLLVFMKLFQSSRSHNNKTLLDGPKVCFYDSTRCVWFNRKYHCERLKKTKKQKLAWPQHPALKVCWRVVHVVPECCWENERVWPQI